MNKKLNYNVRDKKDLLEKEKLGGKMKSKNYLFILFFITSLLIINGCSSEKKTTEPNQAPTVSITSGPSGTITTNQATFSWSGSDTDGTISGYYYDLDDSTPDTWTTNTTKTFNNISNGSHIFYVKAKDNDGELSSNATRSFIVDVVGTESFEGYTNNQGEYTFFSENANQNITVMVENENNFPLADISIDAVHTSNNLIITARDSDDDYYPNLKVVSASQLNKTFSFESSRERPLIITMVLTAYTVGNIVNWLLTDPPDIDLIYNDGNLENICVTGDIEDLVNILGIISNGFGNLLHIGSGAASLLNIPSTYGSFINASLDEILSELIGSNFNTSADYTYCIFEYDDGESIPLVYVQSVELAALDFEVVEIYDIMATQIVYADGYIYTKTNIIGWPVTKWDAETFEEITQYDVGTITFGDLSYDGTHIWATLINDETIRKYDTNFNIINDYSFTLPEQQYYESYPTGIDWFANYLWITDQCADIVDGKHLHKLNPQILIINEYEFDNHSGPSYIAWVGNTLYSTVQQYSGSHPSTIRKHSNSSPYSIEGYYELEEGHPCGLTSDGTYLWVVAKDPDHVYKLIPIN